MTSLATRTHPSDHAWPIEPGLLVPWIPMIPSPPLNSVTVFDRAERPRAWGPHGLVGSARATLSVTKN
jgi:hypothetical protein